MNKYKYSLPQMKNTLQNDKVYYTPKFQTEWYFQNPVISKYLTNRKMRLKWAYLFFERKTFIEKSTLVLLFSSLRPFKKKSLFFFFCYCLYRITVWMGNRMTLNWKCFLFFTTYYLLLWHNTTYIEWIENKVGKRECFCARY